MHSPGSSGAGPATRGTPGTQPRCVLTKTSTPGDSWPPSEPPRPHNPSENAVPKSPSRKEAGRAIRAKLARRRRRARVPRRSPGGLALNATALAFLLAVVLLWARRYAPSPWRELADTLLSLL